MSVTKVKICGLTRRGDAVHAAQAGADYLGVVSVPDTPRFRTPEEARVILDGIPVPGVLVVADLDPLEVALAAGRAGVGTVQLHGDESPETAGRIREEGPWTVWKAVRVGGPAEIEAVLRRFRGAVDGLLLDAWHPEKKGGTGVSFPWGEVVAAREAMPAGLRLILAGGLHPGNVVEAMAALAPDVVDVSSGVEERPGIKDPSRVEAFIRRVKEARKGASK